MNNRPVIKEKERVEGFYKLEGNTLVYAPNRVISSVIDLQKEKKDTYTFPVDGWYWFNNEADAKKYFNLSTEDKQ